MSKIIRSRLCGWTDFLVWSRLLSVLKYPLGTNLELKRNKNITKKHNNLSQISSETTGSWKIMVFKKIVRLFDWQKILIGRETCNLKPSIVLWSKVFTCTFFLQLINLKFKYAKKLVRIWPSKILHICPKLALLSYRFEMFSRNNELINSIANFEFRCPTKSEKFYKFI